MWDGGVYTETLVSRLETDHERADEPAEESVLNFCRTSVRHVWDPSIFEGDEAWCLLYSVVNKWFAIAEPFG